MFICLIFLLGCATGDMVDDFKSTYHTHSEDGIEHAIHPNPPGIKNFPPEDEYDRQLYARLLPLMRGENALAYLAYLDRWRLAKASSKQRSNSFDEEKNRFVNFVKNRNRGLEQKIEAAVKVKPKTRQYYRPQLATTNRSQSQNTYSLGARFDQDSKTDGAPNRLPEVPAPGLGNGNIAAGRANARPPPDEVLSNLNRGKMGVGLIKSIDNPSAGDKKLPINLLRNS